MSPTYASSTDVPYDRSRAEIEKTLARYGASGFAYGWTAAAAMVGFEMRDRQVRFVLPLPPRDAKEGTHTPARGTPRTAAAAAAAYEQSVRQRWRALSLGIKAKLEAVETGIVDFETEFAMHMVLPDGSTVAQQVVPAIEQAYASGRIAPLLQIGQ